MQRKVNHSDSDYHYDGEKDKQKVYKMILECKQREIMPGYKRLFRGRKMGLFAKNHLFLPDAAYTPYPADKTVLTQYIRTSI